MEFTVGVQGQYSSWELVVHIDNSENSEPVKREVESVVSRVAFSYEELHQALVPHSPGPTFGLNVGGLIDVKSVRVQSDLNSEVKREYESLPRTRTGTGMDITIKDIYEVGPGCSLKLYRLTFTAPGLSYTRDIMCLQDPSPLPSIPIEITGRVVPVLEDIELVWTHEFESQPSDIIQDAGTEDNSDINSGFGEEKMWLRPIWTFDLSEGVTGIEIAVESERNTGYKCLGWRREEGFRYLKLLKDPGGKHRITEIALWRGYPEEWPSPPQFSRNTGNINMGRGGDELYLVWNGREIQ